MQVYCPHRITDEGINYCTVAEHLSKLIAKTTALHCEACTNHPTPQGVNGVTCSLARSAQIEAGLEPDPVLFECIKLDKFPIDPAKLAAFHRHWEEIHSYKLDKWDETTVKEFYKDWCSRIPEVGCNCTDHWKNITDTYPIMFSTPWLFFYTTWYAHNILNESLFKRWMPLKEAMKLWLNVSTEDKR